MRPPDPPIFAYTPYTIRCIASGMAMTSEARPVGWLLCAGFALFMVGAVLWRMSFQAPLLSDQLKSVASHPGIWTWIHVWMATGVLVTTAGLAVWVELQRQAGERLATPIAFTLYLLGALFWLVAIALRLTVQRWASGQALQGAIPDVYPSIHRLSGVLYAAHMLLSYVSFAVLGAGVLRSGILGRGVGWTGLAGGGAFALGFVALRGGPFAPPFLAHVYTLVLGFKLLRRG
jgi:hypothetical protein